MTSISIYGMLKKELYMKSSKRTKIILQYHEVIRLDFLTSKRIE